MPSDEEEDQYHEIFLMLAHDGKVVNLEELTFFFEAMPNTPALSQIEEIFNQCDEDQSGVIDADEFINVVETIKLLQNKTTNQILESFRTAKYREIFRLADHDREGTLSDQDVLMLLSKLPCDNHEEHPGILVRHESSNGRFGPDAFEAVVTEAAAGRRTSDVIEACMKALKEVVDTRSSQQFYSSLETKQPAYSRAIEECEDDAGLGECEGCSKLRGRARHLRLAVESEKAVVRETKGQLEEARAGLDDAERMNKDLVFENEKLKKKLRELTAAVPDKSMSSFCTQPEADEALAVLKNSLEEKEKQAAALQGEVDACKKSLTKQKQENGRQSSALALLHKHVAQIEKDNEVLRQGGDREHIRDYKARQKLLTAKLEEAQKTIESFQQDTWYKDKLDYLSSQKNSNVGAWAPAQSKWETDPHLQHTPTAATSTRSRRPLSEAQEQHAHTYRNIGRRTVKVEDVAVEPSDEEYRVLSNYYHMYQNARDAQQAQDLVYSCSDELDKVSTHHPAYWSGKGHIRIKSWMKRPVMSDSVAHTHHKKKYVVTSDRRSASSQPSHSVREHRQGSAAPSLGGAGEPVPEPSPSPATSGHPSYAAPHGPPAYASGLRSQGQPTPRMTASHAAALASVAGKSVSPQRGMAAAAAASLRAQHRP